MMDTATEELYFQKLQDLVFDNDQIVTIPFLARTLNISVQESQKLIQKFTEDQRKLKPDQLTVTYVLTGSLKHDDGRAVLMITEPNLEKKRSSFEEILSEVIFSVQKCKIIDFKVISLVDKFNYPICEEPLLGVIVGSNSVKCDKKIKKLPPPQIPTIKGKSSFFLPKNDSNSDTAKENQPTDSSEAKPSGGKANIFGKASTSNKEKSKASENKSDNKPKGGLSGFLKKGSAKPSSDKNIKSEESIKDNKSSDDNIKKNESSDKVCLMDIEVEDNRRVDEVKDVSKTLEKSESKNAKKETKSKVNKNKRQREKSQEKPTKRRKRIVERDDSESDDMFKNDTDEDIIDKSEEEPDRVPSPVAVEKKPLAPKNKIRRAVDKTYEDEEGFIVTKTEYVYESAPEDENETPVLNEADTPKKKKTEHSSMHCVSPEKAIKSKKGKKTNQNQPTLMNFFKKK